MIPVQFLPLTQRSLVSYEERHVDSSNVFTYTRFLSPHLMEYKGRAFFADGDMVCNVDIAELWKLRDPSKAVQVVKHDYLTNAHPKYLGNKTRTTPGRTGPASFSGTARIPRTGC